MGVDLKRSRLVGANAPARLVREDGRLYAVRGNMRIPVEDPGLVAPSQPAPAPPPTQPIVLAPAARALSPAIDAAALRRDELLQLPGVVDVRAGYIFKDGVITQTPAVVVAVTGVAPGARFDKAEVAAQLGIPFSIAGVPVDLELANPYQRLRRSLGAEAVPASRLPRLLIDELQAPAAEGVSEAVPACRKPMNLSTQPNRVGNRVAGIPALPNVAALPEIVRQEAIVGVNGAPWQPP